VLISGIINPMKLPSISIVIPTLNAEKYLKECLDSIDKQDYPKEKIELIIADGGSKDRTLRISKLFKAKIYANPLKTGEAGKAVGLRHAKNELVAFIDSDNILPENSWMRKMVEPFSDASIVGSEPIEYTYRKSDGFITRYCALLGMNDPLCLFLGNYDRYSYLTRKWTGLPVEYIDRKSWLQLRLYNQNIPTIGANGTIFRRSILMKNRLNKDYLFDIDILASMVMMHEVQFAKVKIGIVHVFCSDSVFTFIKKQNRRIKDFLYFTSINARHYPWKRQNKKGYIVFIIYCLIIIPLIIQSLIGYAKKRDSAWFFHVPACYITLFVYVYSYLVLSLKPRMTIMNRASW
jgi:glycosyltransferase involved in cell wall biosynthesis